jgi:hypothetical protein
LYRLIQSVDATIRQKGVTSQPALIVTVLFWAAIHDRTMNWACQERNWSTTTLRPARIPSPSTMSRRLGSIGVAAVLKALEVRPREVGMPALVLSIDGKPLVVGGLSHDPDAGTGHGAGKIARGYKLHAVWGMRPMPEAWPVNSLDVNEAREAPDLFTRAARAGAAGYVLGDNQYDSSALYDAAAGSGLRLLAARTDPEAGISKGHYQSPERLRAIDQMRRPFGENLMALRGRIEGRFGNATSFAGGLGPLPAWVRRRHRVLRWVWAKLIINGVRVVAKYRLAA